MTGHSTTAVQARAVGLFIAGAAGEKTRPDAPQKLIAHLAIGIEPLLAAALHSARVCGRPVLGVDAAHPSDVERAVMRFGRKRDDEVEIQPLPFLQLLESDRLVPRNIEADLLHDGDGKSIELAFARAGRADMDRAAEYLRKQRSRDRRTQRILAAGEQHRQGLARYGRHRSIIAALVF